MDKDDDEEEEGEQLKKKRTVKRRCESGRCFLGWRGEVMQVLMTKSMVLLQLTDYAQSAQSVHKVCTMIKCAQFATGVHIKQSNINRCAQNVQKSLLFS